MAPLIVAIIAISLYTNGENGNFLGGDNLKNILLQVSVLGIIAIGQTLLIAAGQLLHWQESSGRQELMTVGPNYGQSF